MTDPIIMLFSFIFLFTITRTFLMPNTDVDDGASVFSVLVLVLSIMIYFFGIDPLPAGLPDVSAITLVALAAFAASVLLESVMAFFITLVAGVAVVTYFGWVFAKIPLGMLHIIVVSMTYAMAILDVFFKAVFGIPLSPDFFIYYLIPATFMYKFSKSLLNYVALFSEKTVNFISAVMAFLMLESVITDTLNPVTLILGIVGWLGSRFGGDMLTTTMSIFFLAISTTVVSVLLETVAIVVTSSVISETAGGTSGQATEFNPPA